MSERDPYRWVRFAVSIVSFLAVAVAAPIGLMAVSRARFGSASPLAGVDPPWRWTSGGVGDAVSGPLGDDTVIDGIIRTSLCVVWAALAVIVVTTLAEVVHAVRHRGLARPDIRGLGWAQHIGRFIAVGLVAVLPMMTSATSLAHNLEGRAAPALDHTAALGHKTPVARTVHQTAPVRTAPEVSTHVVRSGESVYSIAAALAGSDTSKTIAIAEAIIEANLGATMPGGQRFTNPAYIEVGWILQVPTSGAGQPASAPPAEAHELLDATRYTVEPGDTLWDIADEQLGDPSAWSDIWQRNAGDDMGDGRTFDDPNLILPGWELELSDAPAEATVPAIAATEPAESNAVDDIEPSTTVPPSPDVAGPLPLTPDAATSTASTNSTTSTTTSTTVASTVAPADPTGGAGGVDAGSPAPEAPAPIRLEHAAMVAAGILALVGVRRRQRLRAARPRHRVPEPRPEVTNTERRLRTINAGERALRMDVASRAAARSLIGTGSQIGWIVVSADGDIELRLSAPATLPTPWTGAGQAWRLGAEVPIELLSEDARQVSQPCVALVQIGITPDGRDVIVDLEACGVLAVYAGHDQADAVVTAVATALASSPFAEVANLVAVSLVGAALLGHRNAHRAASTDAAMELAGVLSGSTAANERSTFELRSLRTGGEMWEPTVVLLTSADDAAARCGRDPRPEPGHGLAVVVADDRGAIESPASRLVGRTDGWRFDAFGASIELTPLGASDAELAEVIDLFADASGELEPLDPDEPAGDDEDPSDSYDPPAHQIVVGLLGGVEVRARTGEVCRFERSKTVELIAWLATHRDRATRTGARTALWELDVRDATFANVVSEARRGLARLVPPPEGEEWVARTLTEQLPLNDLVITDADLVEHRLAYARLQPPQQALASLRPAVELVRDLPFAGTSYLWPDAEGITSNLVLLAITATAEFAGHALSLGDTDGVFWATAQGLRVLPGHEELIALRMQAHAHAGDLAGVRSEWESYERVLVADAWSDGEPAPKLLALRRELLNPSAT